MFKTLDAKLLLVLLVFAAAMAGIFLAVMRHIDMARNQEMHQKLYRSLATQLVEEHVVPDSGAPDDAGVRIVFDRLRLINPRIDVYLLDGNGHLLNSSTRTQVLIDRVDIEPIQRFLSNEAELPITGDDPTEPGRRRVFSAARIQTTGFPDRYLYLTMRGLQSDSITERVQASHVIRASLWVLLWCLLFALLAVTLLVRFITRPLRQLSEVMHTFEQSGFTTQQPSQQAALGTGMAFDIRQLTGTFHAMASRLIDQLCRLRENDVRRRELVANVSHDLRTPLATVRGYLETLHVKDAQLTAEERQHHIGIALKQSSHMARLVEELLEFAKLEGEQTAPLVEPFILDELVQDVVQQFALRARDHGITLEAKTNGDLPLVRADIGMIERVLRNLLDNALQHTPAGGRVEVRLDQSGTGVTVSVCDTGNGIRAEYLPRVFERFFRGDASRGGEQHAGLGLAICKRILDLHGTAIRVISEPGNTVFSFALELHVPAGA